MRSTGLIFMAVGAFLVVASLVYGVWTREYAGTTMLTMASLLALFSGVYLWWGGTDEGDGALSDSHGAESGDGSGTGTTVEAPWFPVASIWPILVAIGITLVGNGLLLGIWLWLPAGAVLGFAVGGFVRQSRWRR